MDHITNEYETRSLSPSPFPSHSLSLRIIRTAIGVGCIDLSATKQEQRVSILQRKKSWNNRQRGAKAARCGLGRRRRRVCWRHKSAMALLLTIGGRFLKRCQCLASGGRGRRLYIASWLVYDKAVKHQSETCSLFCIHIFIHMPLFREQRQKQQEQQ